MNNYNYIFDIENVIQKWEYHILQFSPKVLEAIAILILFFILAKIAKYISIIAVKAHIHLAKIIASIIYFFFLFSGVFLALELLGLQNVLSQLLAGAGIVGIIAGFAFKDIASNIFSGLLLKMHNPYKEGDWIELDNVYGNVLNVGWLTTTIKTILGQEVSIPNQIIYSGPFINYSTWGKRRIIIQSGVSYGDDLDFVKNTTIDEIKQMNSLLSNEEIDFYFVEIGASSYNFILRFWIEFKTNDDFYKSQSEAIMRIKKRFEKENIAIPYNITSLDFGVKGGINLFDQKIKL